MTQKSARDVIAEEIKESGFEQLCDSYDQGARAILSALDAAGYAIVPKGEVERLRAVLETIKEKAFSPLEDDWIWIDDQTPLGLFIDSELSKG